MEITLMAEALGIRLDSFIADNIDDMTRSAAQKLLDSGLVKCGEKTLKKSDKTVSGAVYTVIVPEPAETELVPQNIPLDIVYEDGDVIVINKPRGMVVHPAPGHPDGTLVNALMYHCGDSLSGINGEIRPGIVHRIDMDTSGLIICAKNDRAHNFLSEQLKDHSLCREYEAVVHGNIKDGGTVNAPIGRHPIDRKRQAVNVKNARAAVTHYEPVAHYRGYTHIRCLLETGRTHQIRVHMAHIGHPIVGDLVYGRKRAEFGLAGQCLHARRLEFTHPNGRRISLSCPLPDYFTELLRRLPPSL